MKPYCRADLLNLQCNAGYFGKFDLREDNMGYSAYNEEVCVHLLLQLQPRIFLHNMCYKSMPIITSKFYKNAIYNLVCDIANFNAFTKMNYLCMSPLKKSPGVSEIASACYLNVPLKGLKDAFSFQTSLPATGHWFAGNMCAASCVLSRYVFEIAQCVVLLQP